MKLSKEEQEELMEFADIADELLADFSKEENNKKMKKPIIYSKGIATSTDALVKPEPIFAQGDFDVFVGALDADKLPVYVVINRNTDVVEFTSEITMAYRGFLDHVAPQVLTAGNGQQLDLSLAN